MYAAVHFPVSMASGRVDVLGESWAFLEETGRLCRIPLDNKRKSEIHVHLGCRSVRMVLWV
jgi:hypothetical protein